MKSFFLLVSMLIAILSSSFYFKLKNKAFHNELVERNEAKLLNLKRLTFSGENAEAYFSKDEKHLIFQSHHGDSLCDQIYIMNIETGAVEMVSSGGGATACSYFLYPEYDIFLKDLYGKSILQLTGSPGYDTGAFFNSDASKIVWRVHQPKSETEVDQYRTLLEENSIRPMALQIWTMNAYGFNKQHVTNNGDANFGPYFFPDDNQIVFSSNLHDEKGRNFDLCSVNANGSDLERITFFDGFDGFPMFSPSGKYLVFASNRNQKKRWDTNLFLAEWNYQ